MTIQAAMARRSHAPPLQAGDAEKRAPPQARCHAGAPPAAVTRFGTTRACRGQLSRLPERESDAEEAMNWRSFRYGGAVAGAASPHTLSPDYGHTAHASRRPPMVARAPPYSARRQKPAFSIAHGRHPCSRSKQSSLGRHDQR